MFSNRKAISFANITQRNSYTVTQLKIVYKAPRFDSKGFFMFYGNQARCSKIKGVETI